MTGNGNICDLVLLTLSAIFLGLPSCSPNDLPSEPVTKVYTIESDHWIGLKRIAYDDPAFQPSAERHDVSDFGIITFADTGTRAYESCGIQFQNDEQVFYGAATTQVVIRARPGVHAEIGGLIVGQPAFIELLELRDIAEQRPVGHPFAAPAKFFHRALEPDADSAGRGQQLPVVRLSGGAPSQRQHRGPFGRVFQKLFQHGAFVVSEGGLPFGGKDVRDRAVAGSFNGLVQVGKRPAQPPGQLPADGGLARAHEAHKEDAAADGNRLRFHHVSLQE